MFLEKATIESNNPIAENIIKLTVYSPRIAKQSNPGQFCNIKINDTVFPLLRRPFSISSVNGPKVTFIYDVRGEGTEILSRKIPGELLSILGPLGNSFDTGGDFDTAVLLAGGIGVAPFPFLTMELKHCGKNILTLIGAKNKGQIITDALESIDIATDDGSLGFKGTVIDLFEKKLRKLKKEKIKVFACGPNPMFKELKNLCERFLLDCQVSLESSMACGWGVCQGCVVQTAENKGFKLVCKDGPVFNITEITL